MKRSLSINKCCAICNNINARKYIRGYCIICYNFLLKNKIILPIDKQVPKTLSLRQDQIITGLLLGDGHLEKRVITHNAILRVERSIKDKLYLMDNFNEFKSFCASEPYIRRKDNLEFISFRTRSVELFNNFHYLWYKNKIKVIPNNLALTPLICAIWFCDDGFIYKNRKKIAIRFSTQSFSEIEVKKLCKQLNTILDVNFRVSKIKAIGTNKIRPTQSHYFVIDGAHVEALKFIDYIGGDIPISMNRKLKILS